MKYPRSLLSLPQEYWRLILLAIVFISAFSLYFTLFLPYLSEEGRYTLASLEMYANHYYWQPKNYGETYGRPPLFNWLTLPLMHWLGPKQVLRAARMITATASMLMGAMLWWLTLRLSKDKMFALLTVAVFFSGDFLFRRSWIAYPDTLFALATLTAISFLWLSFKEKKPLFWIPVPFALFAGLLAKAITVYVFYASALIVIWAASENRYYLFKPASLIAHLVAITLPLLWFSHFPHSNWQGMMRDVSVRVAADFNWPHYLRKIIFSPIDVVLRLSPIALLALGCLYPQKNQPYSLPLPGLDLKTIKVVVWIFVISILPYWFSTAYLAPRYLLPLLPFLAIVFTYCIWRAGEKRVKCAILILAVELSIKCVSSFIGLPWFEHMNFPQQPIANDIIFRSQSKNLSAKNICNSFGITITSIIDTIQWPKAPLIAYNPSFAGCVLTSKRDPQLGILEQTYELKAHKKFYIYLYCPQAAENIDVK